MKDPVGRLLVVARDLSEELSLLPLAFRFAAFVLTLAAEQVIPLFRSLFLHRGKNMRIYIQEEFVSHCSDRELRVTICILS